MLIKYLPWDYFFLEKMESRNHEKKRGGSEKPYE
jgi:hypothetical protein